MNQSSRALTHFFFVTVFFALPVSSFLFLGGLVSPATAQAPCTYYVALDGDDANPGTWELPYPFTDNILIEANYIYDSHQGVRFTKGAGNSNISIINNVFVDIRKHPATTSSAGSRVLQTTDNMENLVITHNTIIDSDQWLRYERQTEGLVFRNNLLVNAGSYREDDSIPLDDFDHNGWMEMDPVDTLLGSGDVVGDDANLQPVTWELLEVSYTVDFGLPAGSPLIDAGVDVGVDADFIGTSRPVGLASDIGVYEHLALSLKPLLAA